MKSEIYKHVDDYQNESLAISFFIDKKELKRLGITDISNYMNSLNYENMKELINIVKDIVLKLENKRDIGVKMNVTNTAQLELFEKE